MLALQIAAVAREHTATSPDTAELWQSLRARSPAVTRSQPPAASIMETGLSVLTEMRDAPPRTLQSEAIVASSPLPLSIRSLIETKDFGRRFDGRPLDVKSVEALLPPIDCPKGDVAFMVSETSMEDMILSVDGLLQHRKRLVAPSINHSKPRRRVFILGAGPAGLMAAVQLRLRDHHVVVCEQRETYARNRHIGVYKEVAHLMAALGMPESMTYDFSQYRGKRGIMLADIQTFLHGIALKLGAVIYTGAVPRSLALQTLRGGEVELQRAARSNSAASSSPGITRWQHDSVARVASGVAIQFDTILEATGGRGDLRETLVGKDNVIPLHEIGLAAAEADPSLKSYFDDPEDHTAEYVESDYGCPSDLRPKFAAALLAGNRSEIPDAIPCFVSNIDASVFKTPMRQTENSLGLASRIGDRDLKIPHDWVVIECRRSDGAVSRYHVEGPLPQTFEFGGKMIPTRDALDTLNPVSFLVRILYAMGVPFEAVDHGQLVDFYTAEASRADASDVVSTWLGTFNGLRVGATKPIWRGLVPGSTTIDYGIIGESLQNAWYRFGVGVDDSFRSAECFATGFDLDPEAHLEDARRLESVMLSRSIQILYHLYEVARNKDLGFIGSVLTETHMEEQHAEDLAEARLRELAREGEEIVAAERDICAIDRDSLLSTALDYARKGCCRRAAMLLQSLLYEPEILSSARRAAELETVQQRSQTWAAVEPQLAEHHRALLTPLFRQSLCPVDAANPPLRQERLIELASGRYQWATPWIRICALHMLDLNSPAATAALEAAARDSNPVVAEATCGALHASRGGVDSPRLARTSMIDKVILLRSVSIFAAIPHEVLLSVATLLTERWLAEEELIFSKGDPGDSLYVICEGHVRVHDGDRTIRQMSKFDFFGELSLLDSEPRAASVTAIERTLVFRLVQDSLYALLSDQPVIARAINRELCRKIRNS
jgi:hypothetical protein